jgi:hypothetical protein
MVNLLNHFSPIAAVLFTLLHVCIATSECRAEIQFEHHFIDVGGPPGEAWGTNVIADLDNDGWLDVVVIKSKHGKRHRAGHQAQTADIEAGKVDCVIVYKVDRLSRSLLDLTRIIESFDSHQVTFVGVTHAVQYIHFGGPARIERAAFVRAIRAGDDQRADSRQGCRFTPARQMVGRNATSRTHR